MANHNAINKPMWAQQIYSQLMQPGKGNLPKGATMHIAQTHAQPAKAYTNITGSYAGN